MPAKLSAGILLYRIQNKKLQVFLVHPGGPYWAKKDAGSWSIPKGELGENEDPLQAAIREFHEETGNTIEGNFISLKPARLKSGKLIHAWAVEGTIAAEAITSNLFEIEWPPKTGKFKSFPEVDRAAWFDTADAADKINPAQVQFIVELAAILGK